MTQRDRDEHYCFVVDNTHDIIYSNDLGGTPVDNARERITVLTLKRTNPDDRIKIYLHEIRKAGERAANLTQQLLALSRPQKVEPAAYLNNKAPAGEDAEV